MKNSQLRKHLKRTFAVKIRSFINSIKLKNVGKNIYYERGVSLMRYPKNISLGSNLVIKEGAKICPCNEQSTIKIGNNTTIGYHTYLFASEKIEIGNDCMIAPFVYIVDSDHNIKLGAKMNTQGNSTAAVKIGNDVWIGTGAKILKGVTISDGAVVAAGAIVKDDVSKNAIVGGIPAKQISTRK